MKDSILKGTGNSRFLKSAVPAGTSWADALAMLQAGTFPIDFNGINNAGFQQVGTPLNKANLLKDVNALTLGLTGDAVPNDMFNVLAHAGDLHVWKKTVVVGSYYIGGSQGDYGCICRNTGSASFGVKIQYASEITVDSHENRNLVSPSDLTIIANNSGITSPSATSAENTLKGKFIRLAGIPDEYQNSELRYAVGSVFYCPESISCFVKDVFNDGNHYMCLDGIKNVPTKTENAVTYPVSTNPNAYREGDGAKPAGYTLGATQKNVQILSGGDNWHTTLYYADSVVVDDEGKLSLQSPNSYTFVTSSQYQNVSTFAIGRFIKIVPESGSGFSFMDGIWFVPSDSTITVENFKLYASKIQPVTGYAAIPVGTTIEYLGCLGDKAMVQVVSYVGTGTYGDGNECTVTFDFQPAVVISLGYINPKYPTRAYSRIDTGLGVVVFPAVLSATAYSSYSGFSLSNTANYPSDAKVSPDRKSVIWKNTSPNYQLNSSGYTYYFLGIG